MFYNIFWDECDYPSREVGHITNLGHKINYPDKWPKNVVWSDIWIVKETTWHKSVKYRKMSSFKRYLTALYNARFNIYNLNFVIKHDLAIYSKNCVLTVNEVHIHWQAIKGLWKYLPFSNISGGKVGLSCVWWAYYHLNTFSSIILHTLSCVYSVGVGP